MCRKGLIVISSPFQPGRCCMRQSHYHPSSDSTFSAEKEGFLHHPEVLSLSPFSSPLAHCLAALCIRSPRYDGRQEPGISPVQWSILRLYFTPVGQPLERSSPSRRGRSLPSLVPDDSRFLPAPHDLTWPLSFSTANSVFISCWCAVFQMKSIRFWAIASTCVAWGMTQTSLWIDQICCPVFLTSSRVSVKPADLQAGGQEHSQLETRQAKIKQQLEFIQGFKKSSETQVKKRVHTQVYARL